MSVFKKFSNTDIIYRICILTIFFIIVILAITVKNTDNRKKTQEVSRIDYIIEKGMKIAKEHQEKIEQKAVQIKDESNSENIVPEDEKVIEKPNTIQEKAKTSKEKATKKNTEETVKQKQQDVVQNNNTTEENKQEKENTQQVEANTPQIESKTYKYNKQITQEMINIIKNNPSSYMLQYGYEVIEDSSIVEITNQFTFTNQRVLNKINMKFGTIRVYARDYYVNGEYVWTECFII